MRLLIGGSPCTYWSIAQKNNRETEPGGLGWELFKNYVIAWRSGQFDHFLYENNKSMAKPIRNQIDIEFNHTYAENMNWELISSVEEDKGHTKRWLWINKTTGKTEHITRILINSALVSAQNRQRYYWTNIPNVQQPADRGILLKDILESGTTDKEKAYCLKHQAGNIRDYFKKHHTQIVYEPVGCRCRGRLDENGNGYAKYEVRSDGKANTLDTNTVNGSMVAEPIRIGTIEHDGGYQHDSKQYRVYSPDGKSTTLCGQGGGVGAKTGLYACPIEVAELDTAYYHGDKGTDVFGKIVCKNTSDNNGQPAQGTRIYNTDRKSICLDGDSRKYIIDNYNPNFVSTNKKMPIYQVLNGLITIKDKQYPIKLQDGLYIIRKLTVLECKRLHTVRDNYIFPVSNSQAYKMLGNGWTVEVIRHILSYIPDIANCDVEVLSMYDGMSCGNLALEGLGGNVIRYDAYEIDKYAIQTTQANFPFVNQKGDAFQVREPYWQYIQELED